MTAATNRIPSPAPAGKCDFCSVPTWSAGKLYEPRAHILLETPDLDPSLWRDVGPWVACSNCSALIDCENWTALMKRAQVENPGLRAAQEIGQLRECSEFVAISWSAVFGLRPDVFFEKGKQS
jgi:hypothetical protein